MGSSLNFSYFAFSHPHNIMKRANMGRERDIFWEYVDFLFYYYYMRLLLKLQFILHENIIDIYKSDYYWD